MRLFFGPMRHIGIGIHGLHATMRCSAEKSGTGPFFCAKRVPIFDFTCNGRLFGLGPYRFIGRRSQFT